MNAFASSSATATITMTSMRDLQRMKKNELAGKAKSMNLKFKITDKKAQILQIILDNLEQPASASDDVENVDELHNKEGEEEPSSPNEREATRATGKADEAVAPENAEETEEANGEAQEHSQSSSPVPSSRKRGRARSKPKPRPSASSTAAGKAKRGRPKKQSVPERDEEQQEEQEEDQEKEHEEAQEEEQEHSAPSRSSSVAIVESASKPTSKQASQRRTSRRASVVSRSSSKSKRPRRSSRSSHRSHESLNEDQLLMSASSPLSPVEADDDATQDAEAEAEAESDRLRDASVEQVQDDEEAGSEPQEEEAAGSGPHEEEAAGSEPQEEEAREEPEVQQAASSDDHDELPPRPKRGRPSKAKATDKPSSSRREQSVRDDMQDEFTNFRSSRLRISLPEAMPPPKATARKSTGTALSSNTDAKTIKEIQKDLSVSKFNYETMKQALETASEDRQRIVANLEQQIGELRAQREASNDEMSEFRRNYNYMNGKLADMNEQIESLRATMSTRFEQVEQEISAATETAHAAHSAAQSAQPSQAEIQPAQAETQPATQAQDTPTNEPTQSPQTSQRAQTQTPQPTRTSSYAPPANIPLLSRIANNQPTPRNKTLERVQHQTQKEELNNPSPAPRTLGKHPRPRDSTDSDIVETISESLSEDQDEDEHSVIQPPPKKRFRAAGTSSWGAALNTFGGDAITTRPQSGDAAAAAPPRLSASTPIFGPQFNDAAPFAQPPADANGDANNNRDANNNEDANDNEERHEEETNKADDADDAEEQEIVAVVKDKTSIPPPTPPATKTRYGTERDFDNRFAD